MKLRKAEAQDALAIYKLTKSAFKIYAAELKSPGGIAALGETLEDVQRDLSSKYILVSEENGTILGSIRFAILPQKVAYISRFAIDPKLHNMGCGTTLLNAVFSQCINLDLNAVLLHTACSLVSTLNFYEKNGFHVHSIKEGNYPRALMVNELKQNSLKYEDLV